MKQGSMIKGFLAGVALTLSATACATTAPPSAATTSNVTASGASASNNAAPAVRSTEPVAVIPYRIAYDGGLIVQTMVNGQGPYDFVLDSGSTLTIAFEKLHREQSFNPVSEPPRRVLGITGSDMLDPYFLGNIDIGGAGLDAHTGVLLPDWAPPRETPHGILGLDFMRQYAIVFDVKAKTMTLYPHGGIPKNTVKGWKRVKLTARSYAAASGELYSTRGLTNRKPTNFIIDIGSATTMINYKAAEAMYSSVVSRDLGEGFTTGSRLRDIFDDRTRVRTALINRIQIGRSSWRSVGIWVYDAPIFDEIEVQRLPYGLLGADLLGAQNFAIDFGDNRLFIGRQR